MNEWISLVNKTFTRSSDRFQVRVSSEIGIIFVIIYMKKFSPSILFYFKS